MADDLPRGPVVNTKVWGDSLGSAETEYEMDSFENNTLPRRPQKGRGSGPPR